MIKYLLAISLVLHLGILSIKITKPKPKKTSKKKSEQIVKIKLKQKKESTSSSKEEEIFIMKGIIKMLEKIQKIAKEEAVIQSIIRKCDTFYMGIGVTYGSLFGKILDVALGGPADQAGILVGDTLLDILDIKDKHPEGTTITIPILRDSIIHHIPVTIGKICIDEKKP